MEWAEVLEAIRGVEVPPGVAFAGLLAVVCLIFIVGVRVQLRRLQVLLEEAREFIDKAKEDRRKDEGLERILTEAQLMGVDEQGRMPRRPSSFLDSELQMDRLGKGPGVSAKQAGEMIEVANFALGDAVIVPKADQRRAMWELQNGMVRSRMTDAQIEQWVRREQEAEDEARVNPF